MNPLVHFLILIIGMPLAFILGCWFRHKKFNNASAESQSVSSNESEKKQYTCHECGRQFNDVFECFRHEVYDHK